MTTWLVGVFRFTFPKLRFVSLSDQPAFAAFNSSEVVSLTPSAVAVIVAVVAVLTADAVTVNGALVAPEGTVTDAGTVTTELLLASTTANPLLGASAVRLTEHASVPAPVSDPLAQETALSAADLVGGLSSRVKLELLLCADASRVAVRAVDTAKTVAVNAALVAPYGTVTDAGTCTAVSLLARFTVSPELLLTARPSVTAQLSVPLPAYDAAAHVRPVTGAAQRSCSAKPRAGSSSKTPHINPAKKYRLVRRMAGDRSETVEPTQGASLTAAQRPKGGGR